MSQRKLLDQLRGDCLVKSECLRRLRILKTVTQLKLFSSKNEAGDLYKHFNQEEIDYLNSLPKELLKKTDQSTLNSIKEAEEELTTYSTLTVYLPIELSPSCLQDLSGFLRKKFKTHFLLEIKFDPSLIAGAALAWNGVYKDYSLKEKLQNSHKQIMTIISHQTSAFSRQTVL